MASNSFFVFLPSNVTDYPDNQPNKFRVRLPKSIEFNGSWVCGLHSVSYPYSWHSTIGTLDDQWINIHFLNVFDPQDRDILRVIRLPVPKASLKKVEQLRDFLATVLKHHSRLLQSLTQNKEVTEFVDRPEILASPPPLKRRKRSTGETLPLPPSIEVDETLPLPPSVEVDKTTLSSPPRAEPKPVSTPSAPPPLSKTAPAASAKLTAPPTTSKDPITPKKTPHVPSLAKPAPPTEAAAANKAKPPVQPKPIPTPQPTPPTATATANKSKPPVQPKPATAPLPAPPAAATASNKATPSVHLKRATAPQPIPSSSRSGVSPPPPPVATAFVSTENEEEEEFYFHFLPNDEPSPTWKNPLDDLFSRAPKLGEKERAQQMLSVLVGEDRVKSSAIEYLKEIVDSVEIQYEEAFERFKLVVNRAGVSHLSFSPQLGYVLGFQNPPHVRHNEIAKYGCDLRGGFSSFAVYSKGLTENVIIGNTLSSLLRVVSVTGAVQGEYNEKIYDSPIYARVLPREISEIEIELRTMDSGRLVPFAYGTTMVVLIFKKVINF